MELSGRKVNYGYDTIYRLTNETIASDPNAMNGAVSYSYDAVGNRLQKTSTLPGFPGAASTYNANDELTTDQYDADGNTVGSGANTGTSGYVYDFENHLIQQGGITMSYDGDGNRVSKSTANGTTQYLVDDENPTGYAQVMDELQSSAVVRSYAWGVELVSEAFPPGSPLATGHSPLFYVFDGHGSVRALTGAAGAVTDTYDYDAFGNLIHSTGTTPNNYLFAGEQFDPDLNLYYNRARYLNTSTGRFWNMDTEESSDESPLSLHKYLYSQGDPVDNVDPSGNQIDDVAAFAVSATLNSMSGLNFMTTLDTSVGATGKVPLSGKALDRYVKEKEKLLVQAHCLACHIYMYSRGIDPYIWEIYIGLQTPYDGRRSTISNIDAGLTLGWTADQIQRLGTTPVKRDFLYPASGTVAEAQAPGVDAYFDSKYPKFITQAEIGHEALHNMTGQTDDQLASTLRIKLGVATTDEISQALVANSCAGKD